MQDCVASVVFEGRRKGVCVEVAVGVGRPMAVDPRRFACAVRVGDYALPEPGIFGATDLQALALALSFSRRLLLGMETDGYRFYIANRPVKIDTVFGMTDLKAKGTM